MVRKHIKVEPARWYYHADRLGLLVWQDIPSTPPFDANRTAAQIAQFETEAREIIDEHRAFPSVVAYVPFNEGWGEWALGDTQRVTRDLESYDPTRLMNPHSGFNCCASKGDPGTGDIIDWHMYTGPDAPLPSSTRISVLGEFGGIGLRSPGHEYSPNGQFFAYEQVNSNAQLNDRFTGMIRDVQQLMVTKGLSASIYTEITDVEGEYNGLYTYDRQVQKVDTAQVKAAHTNLINASRNLNATVPLTLGHTRSFQVTTAGLTDRHLRHADSLARTDVISGDLARQDASFRTVAGLSDPRCYSFEAVNQPGRYLRHANSRVRIDANTGGSFAADAPGVPAPAWPRAAPRSSRSTSRGLTSVTTTARSTWPAAAARTPGTPRPDSPRTRPGTCPPRHCGAARCSCPWTPGARWACSPGTTPTDTCGTPAGSDTPRW